MVIDRSRFYTLEHYEYGEPFFGSFRSVCYRLAMEPLKNVHFVPPDKREPAVLRATVWPGPWCLEKTDPALLESRDFPYSEEGLDEAAEWIDERCEGAEELRIPVG